MDAWTNADVFAALYGDREQDGFDWEVAICDALRGRVSLDIVIDVVRQAHEAYREGGREATADL